MIDLHCHILPGVDDGAQSLEDSLSMARSAVSQGITHILCTPHHNNGRYVNPPQDVMARVAALQEEFDKREIPLTLFEGQEIRISEDLIARLCRQELLSTDVDNHYLLIELPTKEIPSETEAIIAELLRRQIVPVIVHPERNRGFYEEPNRVLDFIKQGALMQLTAPSIVGKFGKKIQKFSEQLLEAEAIHMVASDAHRVEDRDFYLKDAYQVIGKKYGQERVAQFQQTAKELINGDPVSYRPESQMIQYKKGWFS